MKPHLMNQVGAATAHFVDLSRLQIAGTGALNIMIVRDGFPGAEWSVTMDPLGKSLRDYIVAEDADFAIPATWETVKSAFVMCAASATWNVAANNDGTLGQFPNLFTLSAGVVYQFP